MEIDRRLLGAARLLTIGPGKLSDRLARIAVTPENREKCYARTRAVLKTNLEIAREWARSLDGFLEWREPQAGAIALMKYQRRHPLGGTVRAHPHAAKHPDRARKAV